MKPYDKRKPILFSTPMVRALLNTKPNTWPAEPIDPSKPYKCQTRRVVKPRYRTGETGFKVARGLNRTSVNIIGEEGSCIREEQPKYWPGDVLWVRETWQSLHNMIEEGAASQVMDRYFYRADYNDGGITPQELHKIINWSWRPSIFMPHEASRLFLEVKQVGIERVLDITEEDARMEGVVKGRADNGHWYVDYKSAFAFLWDHLNAKRGYPWGNNPWVWVYEFMMVKP